MDGFGYVFAAGAFKQGCLNMAHSRYIYIYVYIYIYNYINIYLSSGDIVVILGYVAI